MYIGLWFDENLSFRKHKKRVAEKIKSDCTEQFNMSCKRTLRGPKEEKRCRLLISNVVLVLLQLRSDMKRLNEEHTAKGCPLRCVSAYCNS